MIQPLLFYCYPVFGEMNTNWCRKFESLVCRAKEIIKWHRNLPTFKTGLRRRIAVDVFKALNGISSNEKYELIDHKYNTKRNKSSLRFPLFVQKLVANYRIIKVHSYLIV